MVVLGTNEPPLIYPYLVHCWRGDDGRWRQGSSFGPGYDHTGSNDGVVFCDEAPADAASVLVRYGGREHEVPS
jgi:hypothetical protein